MNTTRFIDIAYREGLYLTKPPSIEECGTPGSVKAERAINAWIVREANALKEQAERRETNYHTRSEHAES